MNELEKKVTDEVYNALHFNKERLENLETKDRDISNATDYIEMAMIKIDDYFKKNKE